jgi:hypothetical protein
LLLISLAGAAQQIWIYCRLYTEEENHVLNFHRLPEMEQFYWTALARLESLRSIQAYLALDDTGALVTGNSSQNPFGSLYGYDNAGFKTSLRNRELLRESQRLIGKAFFRS